MPEETKNDYFIASFIIAAVITAAVFGGCLYIRHIRGDNGYANKYTRVFRLKMILNQNKRQFENERG